jgi:diaminohydroxyphosphoribosylaminopyrimidine deaminase / 5-amino-6-(5-phosphoribosylamino)uracil reductase
MDPFLQRCIALALQAGNRAAPNPLVGAVIVADGQIIGEGYHTHLGSAHAEVNAVASVKDKTLLKHSTLYVNLEPCDHFGKTPPCTNLILDSGIPRVVVGCTDPNPKVAGKGIAHLRAKGVEVILADDQQPFIYLNRRFFVNQTEGRAWISLKWAETADGFISGMNESGNPKPLAITGEATRRWVHERRAENQAILVGKNTVLIDNPQLNVRAVQGNSPVRIILDSQAIIPQDHPHFQLPGLAVIVNQLHNCESGNAKWVKAPLDAFSNALSLALFLFQELEISSLWVEGGAKVLQFFLDGNVFDEVYRFISPVNAGNGIAAPLIPAELVVANDQMIEMDRLIEYKRK